MPYTINRTDGTAIATIQDGTADNSTSLTLFGKSYSNFGEALNENLVRLLENQASTSSPAAPMKGELWFDTTTNQVKVYDGSSFKPTGGAKSTSSLPTSMVTTTVPSSLIVIISLGLYDSLVRDGRLITSNVTSSLKPPLTS